MAWTSSDEEYEPKERYSSSDVIAAAEELKFKQAQLKFKQAQQKEVVEDGLKQGNIKEPEPPKVEIIAKYCEPIFKSEEGQKLFIDRYISNNYVKNKLIPNEIITIIILMIGKFIKNTFKWIIDENNLQKLLLNLENTVFKIENNYIEILKESDRACSFNVASNKNGISFNFQPDQSKWCDREFKLLSTIFVDKTNYKIIDADSKYGQELILPINILKSFNSLTFGCTVDVIYESEDVNTREEGEKRFFYKDIKINKNFNFKWNLNDKLLPSSTHSISNVECKELYYSDKFENNSFIMIFENTINSENKSADKLNFYIKCLQFPWIIRRMKIFCKMVININDKSHIKTGEYQINYDPDGSRYYKDNYNFAEVELPKNSKDSFSLNNISVFCDIKIMEISDRGESGSPIKEQSSWPFCGIINNLDSKKKHQTDIIIECITKMTKIENDYHVDLHYFLLQERVKKLEKLLAKTTSTNNIEYKINEITANDVKVWLNSIGLVKYLDIFLKNGFDSISMIKEINDDNIFDKMGIKILAHKLKIMNEIKKLIN